MRKEYLLEMSATDLDRYALAMGIDAGKVKTVAAKAKLIEERRGCVAHIDVLGMTVDVPVKRMHDKRVTDRLTQPIKDDAELYALLTDVIGEEQVAALIERCTEEDGTIDNDAMGFAIGQIFHSDELKNF